MKKEPASFMDNCEMHESLFVGVTMQIHHTFEVITLTILVYVRFALQLRECCSRSLRVVQCPQLLTTVLDMNCIPQGITSNPGRTWGRLALWRGAVGS